MSELVAAPTHAPHRLFMIIFLGTKVLILIGNNAKLLPVPDSRTRTLIYLNNDVTVLPLTTDLERTIFEGHKAKECDNLSTDENPTARLLTHVE
jgi:hypothetical protein